MLLTTPKLGSYISGAILYDETLHQKSSDGVPFTQIAVLYHYCRAVLNHRSRIFRLMVGRSKWIWNQN